MVTCPWITDKGICGAGKQTAHMQLWYDDGYRSIHCQTCKHMSRSTHWKCSHGIMWHRCEEHRQDPDEHRTNGRKKGQSTINATAVKLLSADRPEPTTQKMRVERVNIRAMGMKRILQSENPTAISLDWTKCPRLSLKFPHLRIAAGERSGGHVEHTELNIPRVAEKVSAGQTEPCTESTQPCLGSGTPPVVSVVQPTRRKFRFPNVGAASSSGGHRSFLPTDGVFVRKADEPERSHYREDDQRSEL